MITKELFDQIGVPVLAVIFMLLFLLESRYQLRKRVQNRIERALINFVVSIPAFVLLRLLLLPVLVWLALKNEDWQLGLNHWIETPAWLAGVLAFLLLDYSNYAWHILLHKLPFLWRFHLVHHTDLDLDVTTAFRFHFGEMVASVFYRGAAVLLTGASPAMVLVYEIAFEAATQFHHSNWKLPFALEKALNKVFVTPRMHGIHHSVEKRETDTNFSVIFSFWDRAHGTMDLNKHQQDLVTGVPAYSNREELTIGYLWKLPFGPIRPWKKFPAAKRGKAGELKY